MKTATVQETGASVSGAEPQILILRMLAIIKEFVDATPEEYLGIPGHGGKLGNTPSNARLAKARAIITEAERA